EGTIEGDLLVGADGLRSGNFVKQPQVTLVVTQVRGNQASVLGMVNRPGRYPIEVADMRLTDLLAMAKRALLIPRVLYREEQWLRASRLHDLSLATCLHPDKVNPETLLQTIESMLQDTPLVHARKKGLPLSGARNFAEFCATLQVSG
ncbi:MAG: hypothetical protein WCR59_09405, partial [Planctomycetota bacterium]